MYCRGLAARCLRTLLCPRAPGNHFPYSGPFFICFSSMLISTASNVVKSARKMKNVSATDIVDTLLMAAFVGSMS